MRNEQMGNWVICNIVELYGKNPISEHKELYNKEYLYRYKKSTELKKLNDEKVPIHFQSSKSFIYLFSYKQ